MLALTLVFWALSAAGLTALVGLARGSAPLAVLGGVGLLNVLVVILGASLTRRRPGRATSRQLAMASQTVAADRPPRRLPARSALLD